MNTIHIPAWHYRAPAIIQRTWGWSPVEEMVLLSLDRAPGTIEAVAEGLGVPRQVASSTIARLMQFGLVEVRLTPHPMLAASGVGQEFIRSGRALPERTLDRETGISIVYERVGQSVLRYRDVDTIPVQRLPASATVVVFPPNEEPETTFTMLRRVTQFMSGNLRAGEWLRGVEQTNSSFERKFLVMDLDDVRSGVFPEGASERLIEALRHTAKTGTLPTIAPPEKRETLSVETTFGGDDLILGSEQHLQRFEKIVGSAKDHVFVLSTFVASQSDEKGRDRRERILRALEDACRRGVYCHLFFGTSLDREKHAAAMQELNVRLSAVRQARGRLLVQRESVDSHAKFLAADDGGDGAAVLIGSCNWLFSPFSAVEVSAELREAQAATVGLDMLRNIVGKLSTATRSAEALQFMASELRRNGARRVVDGSNSATTTMTILEADDHNRLLRFAAHDAQERFICCTNKVGANMVQALFDPAEVAGGRLKDVRVYYSRRSGPVKRSHVNQHRERLNGIVELIGVAEPQLHGKFLAWDKDHVVVSSLNWGSNSTSADQPLDEIGLYFAGPNIATRLLERFEAESR
ncbi:MarR family transcriptional regulator [Mesorhizobium sp. M0166]|uniref:hypothetical protein n=1 Tax=Mesorhizobium sp. M0166 TaxID=2956902 RepID=UPI003338B054